MINHLKNKLCIFIGRPTRCTRSEALDELMAVGGIIDNNVTTFINYAVAFDRAEKTVKYQKALKLAKQGFLTIITEQQFFDMLEGKSVALNAPEPDKSITIIPPQNAEAYAREMEHIESEILNRKRINNLAQHGIPTKDGRVKIDLRPLDKAYHILKKLEECE